MMVISARNYADFKLLANALPGLAAIFHNDSVSFSPNPGVIPVSTYSVAYGFDSTVEHCVCVETTNTFTLATTDFAVTCTALSDRLNVSNASAFSTSF